MTTQHNERVEETAQKIQDLYFDNGATVSKSTWDATVALLQTYTAECEARGRAEERARAIGIVAEHTWNIPMNERQGTGMGWHNADITNIIEKLGTPPTV